LKRLAFFWLVCAAAGFAVLVVVAIVLSLTFDTGGERRPAEPELRPQPGNAPSDLPARDVGHERLTGW
jgi:hypothetical protein